MLPVIDSNGCQVIFKDDAYQQLNTHLDNVNYSKVFILVDENTHEFCLPAFLAKVETNIQIEIIEIEAGEEHKTIETCSGVWNALSELGADRKSLMINLGGGVVTDLGGFVASTFMRGMAFVNVPTSLLAMVDASVGGKTGVDLGLLKNQIGVINLPEMVLIDHSFLKTLPKNQMRSGLTEMLKHGLIFKASHWKALLNKASLDLAISEALIYESVAIKNEVVMSDPTEKGLRKILNFGHTLGHAIESYFLQAEQKKTLLHGEAIAIGIILEAYLSNKSNDLADEQLRHIKEGIQYYFTPVDFNSEDIDTIIDLLKFDKKNSHGNINFVLLDQLGKASIDHKVTNQVIKDAFNYYSKS